MKGRIGFPFSPSWVLVTFWGQKRWFSIFGWEKKFVEEVVALFTESLQHGDVENRVEERLHSQSLSLYKFSVCRAPSGLLAPCCVVSVAAPALLATASRAAEVAPPRRAMPSTPLSPLPLPALPKSSFDACPPALAALSRQSALARLPARGRDWQGWTIGAGRP